MKYPNTNIAIIRRMRGLSQAYVAEKIGVSRPKYIYIERGERDLTVTQLRKLTKILDASADDLIAEDFEDERFRKFLKKAR